MSRWNLRKREHVPAGAREAEGAHADTRLLSPGEVREQRLRLAWELAVLVMRDGETLPPPAQQRLQAICNDLRQLWAETRPRT